MELDWVLTEVELRGILGLAVPDVATDERELAVDFAVVDKAHKTPPEPEPAAARLPEADADCDVP